MEFISKSSAVIGIVAIGLFTVAIKLSLPKLIRSYLHISDAYLQSKVPPFEPEHHPHKSEEKNINAGCLIYQDGKVVHVRYDDNPHFRNNKKANTVSIPGGTADKGELSTYTAYRETYEESGIRVRVVKKITTFNQAFNLYLCKPYEKITDENLKHKKRFEIKEVLMVDMFNLTDNSDIKMSDFSYPDQALFIKNWVKDNKAYLESEYLNI